jgi:5'-deoxynucleotidase YfbR-like HD superfamily hydrolase
MLYKPTNTISPTSILLSSRRYLDLLEPKAGDFTIDDMARGLAVPRFRNQGIVPIPVDEHCLRCGRIGVALGFGLAEIIALLLHDSPEFGWGDLPGPIKRFVRIEVNGVAVSIHELEMKLLAEIVRKVLPWDEKLGADVLTLCAEPNGRVKDVDNIALRAETLSWLPGSEDWADVPSRDVWPAVHAPIGSATWGRTIEEVRHAGGRAGLDQALRRCLLGNDRW